MPEVCLTIPAVDSFMLSAILRTPEEDNDKKIIIQIHCGTGIPQKLYANFAKYLTERGFTTLTFDYRGVGESRPKSLKGFDAHLRDWGKLDMTGVFNWVIDNFLSYKKIIVAHSMGGQLIGLMENNYKIDKIFLIASSTGYWKDMSSPYKWLLPPVWFVFIPYSIFFFGYANAKKIKQGESLPKGVAKEWKRWCINKNYFEIDFGKTLNPLYFNKVEAPITSIQISDDPIANSVTANKLLEYYTNSTITIQKVSHKSLNVEKIGHFGYFSRKFKNKLWSNLVKDILKN